MNSEIENSLNLRPMTIDEDKKEIVIHKPVSNNQDEADFALARDNLKDLIDLSREALEELYANAKQSTAPRDYEVLNQMLKTASELNETLMSIPEKRNKALNIKPDVPTTQTNTLIVGTTAEISKMIEDKIKGIDNDKI